MSVTVSWQGGGTAVIDVIEGDRVELLSTRAFAPGSRPEGIVALHLGARSDASAPASVMPSTVARHRATDTRSIWLKVHGSRRQDDGAFRVKGRLLNVRRELLDLLKEVVPGSNDGKSSTS